MASSSPYEPVTCHTFITECTFGLPIYRWKPADEVFSAINDWWRTNAAEGVCSIVQRLQPGQSAAGHARCEHRRSSNIVHGAIADMNTVLEDAVSRFPVGGHRQGPPRSAFRKALVITPVHDGTPVDRPGCDLSTAMASG